MNYRTISLKVLIDEFGKKKAFELLSKFSCPLNNDVEEFVHQKAIPFERAKKQMKENNEITTKTVGKGKEREMMINLNK